MQLVFEVLKSCFDSVNVTAFINAFNYRILINLKSPLLLEYYLINLIFTLNIRRNFNKVCILLCKSYA